MQIGFNLPLSGALTSADAFTRPAVGGGAIDFDYIALSDHIVEPLDIRARYPYSETGEVPRNRAASAPRAAGGHCPSRGQDLAHPVSDLGDGGAASDGRAHGKVTFQST
jgi:hypothetical protein